jgi:hypothetical protein
MWHIRFEEKIKHRGSLIFNLETQTIFVMLFSFLSLQSSEI